MNTFTGYIEHGKGRGLVYFLIVSLVLSMIFGISMHRYLQDAAKDETVSNFIDRMPSFTIQNGQVVQPDDAYIFVPFEQGGQDGFILDTTNTPADRLAFSNGVYVTKNKVYFKNDNNIQELAFDTIGDKVIAPETLRVLVSQLIVLATFFYVLFFFGILWIGYGILYVLVKFFFLIWGRTTCPYIRGRSVFVAWSCILILDFVLTALGYGFSPVNALTLSLILAIFIVFRMPLHSMDVEESLNALGRASSEDNMDFLDRELAKNPDSDTTSLATEKTLAQLADTDESESTVQTLPQQDDRPVSKTNSKFDINTKGKLVGRSVSNTSSKRAKVSSKTTVAKKDGRKSHPQKKAGDLKKKA